MPTMQKMTHVKFVLKVALNVCIAILFVFLAKLDGTTIEEIELALELHLV